MQRTLSALKTSWRLAKEEVYEADFKAVDGTSNFITLRKCTAIGGSHERLSAVVAPRV